MVLEYFEDKERELLSEIIPIDDEGEEVIFATLEEIEKEHDILQYDICFLVRYDFENAPPTVRARVESEVRDNEEMSHKYVEQLKDELGLESEVKHWNTDEMSDITVLLDESVVRLNDYSEQTFSEAEDAFVFTQFKESMEVKMPVYHIYKEEDAEKMEACIYLMKVLEERSGNVNRQSEKSRMMAAWFDLGYDRYRYPSVG